MRHLVIYLAMTLAIVTPIFAQGGGTPTPGNRIFNDDFATFVNRWESTESESIVMGYEAQAFQIDLNAANLETTARPNNERELPRFVIATNLQYRPTSATDSFGGILFGYQDPDNFYVFGLRPSGHYEVHLKLAGVWQEQPLVRGFYDELLNTTDAVYRLQITYDGGRYSLSINDKMLVPFYDATLGAGEFGLFGQSGSDGAHFTFDNFVVYDLVYEASDATPAPTDTAAPEVTPAPTNTPEVIVPTLPSTPEVTPTATDEPEVIPTTLPSTPEATPVPSETQTIPRI